VGRILNSNVNVVIDVGAAESLNALEGVPPARMQARRSPHSHCSAACAS
jgi:hypothetical protein